MIAVLSALPLFLLQVGPNPAVGAMPDMARDLRERPAAPEASTTPPTTTPTRDSRLSQCLLRARNDARGALDYAQAWRETAEDGELAQTSHCAGLALVRLGRFDEARQAFGAARDEAGEDNPAYRARLSGMAGHAALAGEDDAGALAQFEAAEADAALSGDAALRAGFAIDQARALVALGRSDEAAKALASARELNPADPRAWLLSATLSRRLERLGEAQKQIEYAADLDPRDPAIGLEAGVIAALAGREADARASFASVVEVAPDSPEAQSARRYLAQLGGEPAPQ